MSEAPGGEADEAELAAWFAARSERTIETACARVFLAGDAAFKVKRRVNLGYVDYSTLERRLWAIGRELTFNRAAASDIYRAVRRITRSADGFEIDGLGPVVDYALEMRRFADDAVLAAKPWAIDGALADRLGRNIARFHAAAPLRPDGGLKSLAFTIGSNAQLLRQMKDRLGDETIETLIEATEAELTRQTPLLAARTAGGFSRHCHGDLHLGNILVEDDAPILFDCIEFNDLLSDLDVLYDLAFLLMDLDFRRRRDAGVRVLSAWLDEFTRNLPIGGLFSGLAALPLMLSVRAAVRAHVWAHSGDDAAARAYVEAAITHLSPAPPALVAVGGYSGTGKSSFARLAAPGIGASPGAVVLRTDEVRKHLGGAAYDQPLGPQAYAPAATTRVYDQIFAAARELLAAGRAVVLDATFLDPALRNRAETLASTMAVPFHGVWLTAPPQVLEARIAGRRDDASDATVTTLRDQLTRPLGAMAWTRVDAAGPVEASAEAWVAGLG